MQRYERGKVVKKLESGSANAILEKTGTKVTFLPDGEIFEETVYDYEYFEAAASGKLAFSNERSVELFCTMYRGEASGRAYIPL